MVTLREVARQALKALESCSGVPHWSALRPTINDLRQALAADTKPCACCGDTKPCACCGEGKARISVTRICDTCGSEYAGQAEFDLAKRLQADQQAEPVAGVVLRDGLPTLLRDRDIKASDVRLCTAQQPAQQPLTIRQMADAGLHDLIRSGSLIELVRAVERMHHIK